MASNEEFPPVLDDIKVHVKLKLFALWSSVMFFSMETISSFISRESCRK